jgi:hypothetical protein
MINLMQIISIDLIQLIMLRQRSVTLTSIDIQDILSERGFRPNYLVKFSQVCKHQIQLFLTQSHACR